MLITKDGRRAVRKLSTEIRTSASTLHPAQAGFFLAAGMYPLSFFPGQLIFSINVLDLIKSLIQPDWRAHLDIRPVTCRLFLLLLLLSLGFTVNADVIDPYTAAQGPFTVGPNETISEEEAVVLTSSVLGGFRVALPAMGDDAAAGSTATLDISGGTYKCSVDFPNIDEVNNGGGCSGGHDRGEGPVFDLSGSTAFQFDVQSVEGGMALGIILVDTDENLSIGLVENVTTGQLSLRFDELFSLTSGGVNFASIDNISLTVVNQPGMEGSVTLGEFSTDGPITGGPSVPTDDEIVAEELSGSYFDPTRDGEGCQLTQERDDVNFVMSCYFYDQGEQFWLIGAGILVNDQIIFSNMVITSGADYGDDFDPADVVRATWGTMIMTWGNCNNAELELIPVLAGYEQLTLELTRIVPITCGGGGPQGDALPWMGAFFDTARDGEGFHLAVEGDGSTFVMTWYTYLDGKQVWMIGSGVRNGSRIVFENIVITNGANFGSEFDPADVIREVFGTITIDFSDCNNFTAMVDTVLPEFSDIMLDVTKIIPGSCP